MRIRFCAALVASLIVSGAAAPRAQKAPAPAAKKNPLLKLTEPWPTDEVLQAARVVADARRLFRETEPLAFTLTADFTAVNREREGCAGDRGEDRLARPLPTDAAQL